MKATASRKNGNVYSVITTTRAEVPSTSTGPPSQPIRWSSSTITAVITTKNGRSGSAPFHTDATKTSTEAVLSRIQPPGGSCHPKTSTATTSGSVLNASMPTQATALTPTRLDAAPDETAHHC